jgi:hypothetical protein
MRNALWSSAAGSTGEITGVEMAVAPDGCFQKMLSNKRLFSLSPDRGQ